MLVKPNRKHFVWVLSSLYISYRSRPYVSTKKLKSLKKGKERKIRQERKKKRKKRKRKKRR